MIDAGLASPVTRVLHVVTGLGRGGAETSLLRTIAQADPARFQHHVVALMSGGELAPAVRETGAEVLELGAPRGMAAFGTLPRLRRAILDWKPDLVQTWMYHSDLMGGLAAGLAGKPPVVWGLHHSNLDPSLNKRSTLWVARMCARLSRRLPAAIVCCSEATRRVHVDFGYDAGRMRVIFNGYDPAEFQPDPEARAEVRRELGLEPDDFIIGMVGRFHPQKDHGNFLAAARQMLDAGGSVRFVLCGQGVDRDNSELTALVDRFGLRDAVHLLGERSDPQRVMNSFDLGTISSAGEGFPNVVCEMMLCGLPCAVTDVGDAAFIVDTTGGVAPAADPSALSREWLRLHSLGEGALRELGLQARQRVVENFSAATISRRYHDLWLEVLGQ